MITVCYPTGYLLLAVLLILLFAKASTVFYVFTLSAPLTTVAVFDVGGESIIFYQLVFVILVFKTLVLYIGNRRDTKPDPSSVSPAFWVFWVFCACSIPLALLNGNVVVINPDAEFTGVEFSFQQFTQFGYLTIAFLSCYLCNRLLRDGVISPTKISAFLTVSYILVCVLALLQLVLPAELVTEFYRNSTHSIYAYQGARISSTFNEPSMLSLFIAPLFCVYLYRFVTDLSWRAFALAGLGLAIIVLNYSSSFIVGVIFAAVAVFLFKSTRLKAESTLSHKLVLGIVSIALISLLIISSEEFGQVLSTFFDKISGEGASGSQRTFSFYHHFQVFLAHPVVGVGFGTVRSIDLLTTWLAELGIIGFACFAVPLLLLLGRLAARSESSASEALIYIAAYIGILFVSVPEPYYVFGWIVMGLGFHIARFDEKDIPDTEFNNFLAPQSATSCFFSVVRSEDEIQTSKPLKVHREYLPVKVGEDE